MSEPPELEAAIQTSERASNRFLEQREQDRMNDCLAENFESKLDSTFANWSTTTAKSARMALSTFEREQRRKRFDHSARGGYRAGPGRPRKQDAELRAAIQRERADLAAFED